MTTTITIQGHIAAAYETTGDRVADLADIRKLCPTVSREEMDQALVDMHREGIITLHSQGARYLTADDRAAALEYGPGGMHRLTWNEF